MGCFHQSYCRQLILMDNNYLYLNFFLGLFYVANLFYIGGFALFAINYDVEFENLLTIFYHKFI